MIEACYEIASYRDRLIIDLGRYVGLRRKEIAFLEWRDIHVDYIFVPPLENELKSQLFSFAK